MSHPLRPYQADAIESLRASLRAGNRRPLLQLATGSGKTRIAAAVIAGAVSNRKKCLFLAPRRELIHQARAAFAREGVMSGIIMAGERPSPLMDVQVASFDTLHARAIRASRMEMPDADVVIVDESHLSVAETRKEIISRYGGSIIVGLTATPARGDGKGLGEIYDDLVLGPSVQELTDMGFLVPLRYFGPSEPDLSAIKVNKDGDYQEKGLATVMDSPQLVGDIVENWVKLAATRRTVVFCVNRAHSRHVCEHYVRIGVAAEHLDGDTETEERKAILARVASGETQVLCNVFVATYGLDIPALDCAVMARPTKNIALYLQMAGRIMRPFSGKVDGLIIDHAGAVDENGFVTDYVPWSLDPDTKVKDRKEASQKERKEPKLMKCPQCHGEFKGRRDCPYCGHQALAKTEKIPVHEAELQEIKGKAVDWSARESFYCQLLSESMIFNWKQGRLAHMYKDKFGEFPDSVRFRNARPVAAGKEVQGWIKSRNIKFAKSQIKLSPAEVAARKSRAAEGFAAIKRIIEG